MKKKANPNQLSIEVPDTLAHLRAKVDEASYELCLKILPSLSNVLLSMAKIGATEGAAITVAREQGISEQYLRIIGDAYRHMLTLDL